MGVHSCKASITDDWLDGGNVRSDGASVLSVNLILHKKFTKSSVVCKVLSSAIISISGVASRGTWE